MSISEKENFTEVNLLDLQRKKAPKRLIYFSDGVLEEFSSDDEEEVDSKEKQSQTVVDPSTLKWVPYFSYMLWMFGARTLAVCDYLGENLAWFFGITTPKYKYELDLYEKITKEEEELQKHIKEENAGWVSNSAEQQKNAVNLQPKAIPPDTIIDSDIKHRKSDSNATASNLV